MTALAALEEGLITPTRKIDDTGHWEYGGREYQNAKERELRLDQRLATR